MKTFRLLLALLLAGEAGYAQTDTVRIATYNLLNYGNSANPVAYKNQRLQPILVEIKPSIQCFNEVSTAIPGLLDTLLKVLPYNSEHGSVHNTTSTTQLDGLFWRKGVFHLLHDSIICSDIRDIVAYDLYWDYPGLSVYKDTLKLTVITAHLKSSNAAADKADRAGETQKVSAYLSALNKSSNILMLGDFNVYSSSETAYQNLTNPSNPNARLNDPLNKAGNWDNNSSFADIHTQSPRLAALSDGGASGGLDSRFDFILVSDAVLNGSKGMKYEPGSYKAFGNDGQHYGRALTDAPANVSVSASIAQALYECSDHLPVFGDFLFTPPHHLPAASIETPVGTLRDQITIANPFQNAIQLTTVKGYQFQRLHYRLFRVDGVLLEEGILVQNARSIVLNSSLSAGVFILRLQDEQGVQGVYRLVHF